MTWEKDSTADPATTTSLMKQKTTSGAIVKWRPDTDEEWNRREQSRRVDAEYVNRRMPGGYKL